MIKDLQIIGSHSGCTFELDSKCSRLIKYQNSCFGAVKMQLEHRNTLYKTPAIYWSLENSFCMEYIQDAVPFPQYVESLSNIQMYREAYRILSEIFLKWDVAENFDGDLFIDKIYHVITRLKKIEHIKLAELIEKSIKPSYQYPSGKYHGDLTMANILFSPSTSIRYLIDFLPGYINSPVLDIVKLKQEYKLHWSSLIMHTGNRYEYFLNILSELCEDTFKEIDTADAEALNLLRILPYVTDINIEKLLIKSIKKLCNQ